jgi:hypothetical protein
MNIGALSRRHILPTSYRADKRTAENWALLRPERHPVFVSGHPRQWSAKCALRDVTNCSRINAQANQQPFGEKRLAEVSLNPPKSR